jgi:hypothetical protein
VNLSFEVEAGGALRRLEVDIRQLVIAGWAGRDLAAVAHHIEELRELGVPAPSEVPLFYRTGNGLLTQAEQIQVVGDATSGEVETFLFMAEGELYVSLISDHTDRKLESHSVALSKQICPKPVASAAWRLADVAEYWDELVVRSWIEENGKSVLYQEGPLALLRTPLDLIGRYTAGDSLLPPDSGMSCGTPSAMGGIRPSSCFTMELFDPRRECALRHHYKIDVLPEVS